MNPLSNWTYFRRHKGHATLLLGLSIIVTIGVYSTVALVWGVFVEPPRQAYMTLSELSIVTPGSGEDGLESAAIAQIEANRDVARVIPTTWIRIQLPGIVPGQGPQFDLLGLMEGDVPYVLERFGATLRDGRLPQPGTNGLLLSEDIATMLGVRVGDEYDAISVEFYANMDALLEPTTFQVVGVLASDVELGIVSLGFLRNHAQYREFPARFLVVAQEGRQAAVDDFLRSEVLSTQTSVMTFRMLNERIVNEALPALLMLVPIVLAAAVAFSLVTVVVNQIATSRRLSEFAIKHAVGLSKGWLVRQLTMETATLTLIGWALGIGLSWLALYVLKVTYFASRGHELTYIAWVPVVSSLPIPATVTGFTSVAVRRTLSRLDPVAIVERGELSEEEKRGRQRMVSESSSNPLSPTTFYNRHRRRASLLIGGMGLMILVVVLFAFALAMDADANTSFLGYLGRVSIVRSPGVVQSLDPGVVAQVEAHPAVARIIPTAPRMSMLRVQIPPFGESEGTPFAVYAEDMAYLVELYGLEMKEGHLPRPGSNEMALPESLAENRDIEIGDVVGNPHHPAYPGASSLPAEFVVSGIFARPEPAGDGDGLGFISLEFLETSGFFSIPDIPPLIVVPKMGQKDILDNWLENELAGESASVLTYRQQVSRLQDAARQNMFTMALLESVIVVVTAIGLAVLNYVLISQRQSEFGVLHALGYGRTHLVRRVLGETAFTVVVAWGLSAAVAVIGMLFLRVGVYEPRGLTFSLVNITPWLYTLPIPIVVLAVTTGTTAWTLARLDPVAIVERRQ